MIFKADLHIHTVLSPCGELEMSPSAIIETARLKGLDIIGITDHNSTLNAEITRKLGEKNGIFVLMGAEVQTIEEVHCLCFMPDNERLRLFQQFLDENIIKVPNDVKNFGYQLVVDEFENILDEIPYFLVSSLKLSIEEVSKKVYELDGIFIPAHVDRPFMSLSSQLGFVPTDLKFDILELSRSGMLNDFPKTNKFFENYTYITSSDSHYLKDIARVYTEIELYSIDFCEIKRALELKKVKPIISENNRFTYY